MFKNQSHLLISKMLFGTLLLFSSIFAYGQTHPIDVWANQYPDAAQKIEWFTQKSPEVLTNYPNWSPALKTKLHNLYDGIIAGNYPDFPSPMTNLSVATIASKAVISDSDAETLYLSYLATSLYFEISNAFSWKIVDYDNPSQWRILSCTNYVWISNNSSTNYTPMFEFIPRTTPASPAYLKANFFDVYNVIDPTNPVNTIGNIFNYERDNFTHFYGSATIDNNIDHWQYSAYPPMDRIIDGTSRNSTGQFAHWTQGCWGTVGFTQVLGLMINIPMDRYIQATNSHNTATFPSFGEAFISHGDDPYSQVHKAYGLDSKYLLIDGTHLKTDYFQTGQTNSEDVGRRIHDLSLHALPSTLQNRYCQSYKSGEGLTSTNDVTTYHSSRYPAALLESIHLYERLQLSLNGNPNFTSCWSNFNEIIAFEQNPLTWASLNNATINSENAVLPTDMNLPMSARSSTSLTNGDWVEAVLYNKGPETWIGLDATNSNQGLSTLDYAIKVKDNVVGVYRNGTLTATLQDNYHLSIAYLKIGIENGQVKYYLNGFVRHQHAATNANVNHYVFAGGTKKGYFPAEINDIYSGAFDGVTAPTCLNVSSTFSNSTLTHSGAGSNSITKSFSIAQEGASFSITGIDQKTNGPGSQKYIERVTVSYVDGNGVTQNHGNYDGNVQGSAQVLINSDVKSITVSLQDILDGDSGSSIMSVTLGSVTSCNPIAINCPDSDSDGVCDANDTCPNFDDALIGTSCNDNNVCTTGDVYDVNCNCGGTFQDADNDGVCDANDICAGGDDTIDSDGDGIPDFCDSACNVGAPCNDNNACTTGDVYDANCECVGTVQDADNDGVCDANDVCPNFNDNLIGTACNDDNNCTTGDTWDTNCNCTGTFQDADNDGVCDANDTCPNLDDNLIGTACDDGDPNTTNDSWETDCACAGTPVGGGCTTTTTVGGTVQSSNGSQNCRTFNFNGEHQDISFTLSEVNRKVNGNPGSRFSDLVTVRYIDANGSTQTHATYTSNTTVSFAGPATALIICIEDNDGQLGKAVSATVGTISSCVDDGGGNPPNCTPGTTCNDGDACTTGDVYDANCNCTGTFADSDNDGVCNSDDVCPNFNDNLIGTACNDGDPNTINDTWDTDCNCTGTPNGGGGCTTYNSESFETNWGIWTDGGSDVSSDATYANTGTYCVRLRDNSGQASSIYTDALNLSTYSSLDISFSFFASSMENGEDFYLEMSTNGGSSYSTVQRWISGTDFINGTRYNETVSVSGFSSSTVFRIRCDASANNDRVYIDDVVIEDCSGANKLENELNHVTIYPNPSDMFINIDVSKVTQTLDTDNIEVNIFSLDGKRVYQNEMQVTDILHLNIEALSSSQMYLLHLRTDDGRMFRGKFLKF